MSDASAFRFAPVGRASGHGADRVRERARAEGYVAGHAAGVRAAAREAQAQREAYAAQVAVVEERNATRHAELVSALEAAIAAAQARTAPVLADAQATLFAAAVQLASAIIGTELTAETSAAVAALGRVTATDPAPQVIRMNPADAALVQDTIPASAQVVPDETVARGDAFSEHEDGFVDASVTHALERALAAVSEGSA